MPKARQSMPKAQANVVPSKTPQRNLLGYFPFVLPLNFAYRTGVVYGTAWEHYHKINPVGRSPEGLVL